MDLLEMLNSEITGKHFTKEELMRYIYIRTCEIFSFDSRYYYMYLFPELNENDIINYYPKITNIKRKELVCKSYSRYILKRLLRELCSIDADDRTGIEHTYVIAKLNEEEYELDATLFDFARIKMGLHPTGYKNRTDRTKNEEYYKKIDKAIGYIKDNYEDYNDALKDLNYDTTSHYRIKYSDIYRKVAAILKEYPKNTKSYSDVTYLINSLEGGIIPIYSPSIRNEIFRNDYKNISKIYKVIDQEKSYFLLDKKEDNYTIEELDENKYKELSKKIEQARRI